MFLPRSSKSSQFSSQALNIPAEVQIEHAVTWQLLMISGFEAKQRLAMAVKYIAPQASRGRQMEVVIEGDFW